MSTLSATRWTVVQAAKAGDADALRQLFEKYRPAVVGYLLRRGMKGEAEDVAQEVCVQLMRALEKADPKAGRFRALVFAITRNLMGKHLQKANALKRGGGKVVKLGERDVDLAADMEPDDDFDREWLAILVRRSLARLAEEHENYFMALERFLLRGEAQQKIADDLGISVGAVKKHVHRGKKPLRRHTAATRHRPAPQRRVARPHDGPSRKTATPSRPRP